MKELGMDPLFCHEDLFPGMGGTLFGDPDDMYGWRDSSVFFAGLYREQEPAMYGRTGWMDGMGWSLKARI